MDLRSRFVNALQHETAGRRGDISPSRMSRATVEVLSVAGAGLVMMQDLVRWPVGASDEHARHAEQVQATLNEGPCLTAAREGRVLAINERDLAQGWPVYHHQLRERTPYRSTLSFPIRADMTTRTGPGFAALNLYCAGPTWQLAEELTTISDHVVDLLAALLLLSRPRTDPNTPGWTPESQTSRDRVWTSVGMITVAASVTAANAIAILRGYAFAHDLLLDDVADHLYTGHLTTQQVLQTRPT